MYQLKFSAIDVCGHLVYYSMVLQFLEAIAMQNDRFFSMASICYGIHMPSTN